MTALTDILDYLDGLLESPGFPDYGPNGLQVPGRADVGRVVTAVSAHGESIARAVEARADLLLVHHGLLWDFHPRALSPVLAGRLKALLGADISLVQYHLPLDAHPEHGNNALLAEALGASTHEPFAPVKGRPLGRIAHLDGGVGLEELIERVRDACDGREPLVFPFGPVAIRTIGIVSGGAAKSLPDAVTAGCDAFLTGEPAEHVMADAREAGIHFIAAGHYATETHGIRRLGELLERRFGLEHVFADIPNPV